jgi:small ligand-binding sensory domain FIST
VWGSAEVPQGALVWRKEADRQALLDGATWSCTEAVAGLDGLAPLGVLAFDCGGRRAGLVEGGMDEEIEAMRTALGGAPFAGLYTVGEIARVRGASGMHHLTLVTLALA